MPVKEQEMQATQNLSKRDGKTDTRDPTEIGVTDRKRVGTCWEIQVPGKSTTMKTKEFQNLKRKLHKKVGT